MKKEVLLVGENSLLKLKLTSILSRSYRVHTCCVLQEAERFLSNMQVGYTILCDLFYTDLKYAEKLSNGGQLICLTSIDMVGIIYDVPRTGGVMQILYDQIYGFSGYSTSNPAVVQCADIGRKRVCPTLVDDIAFWLSRNLDSEGLYYLRGPLTMTTEEYAHAVTMKEPYYSVLEEETVNKNWLGTIVLLRHTLEQGLKIMQRQRTCSVNLIYKLPLYASVAGSTVEAFRERLGTLAGLLLPETLRSRLDYICPVPNSGIPYAKGVSEASGVPLVHAVKKTTQVRSFHIEDEMVRCNMIANTMQIDAEKIRGAVICLVDEAIFTGSTLKILCKMLRAYGAKEIHVLIPTPPCTKTCQYCSIPTRPMLLETISREELEGELGVDSVIFQSIQTMNDVLQETNMTCCDCFS